MVWVVIIVALVLIVPMGLRARKLQGGPSYDGVTVHHRDEDYDAIQRQRIAEGDPYRGGAGETGPSSGE